MFHWISPRILSLSEINSWAYRGTLHIFILSLFSGGFLWAAQKITGWKYRLRPLRSITLRIVDLFRWNVPRVPGKILWFFIKYASLEEIAYNRPTALIINQLWNYCVDGAVSWRLKDNFIQGVAYCHFLLILRYLGALPRRRPKTWRINGMTEEIIS